MKVKVQNMISPRSGNEVANQFMIYSGSSVYFQSYSTVIAKKDFNGKVTLDPNYAYSATTGKYRNEFLREGIAETRKKIENGTYTIEDLN